MSFKYHLLDDSPTYTNSSAKTSSLSFSFHSVNILDSYYELASVLGVGDLTVLKRLMICNYPVSRGTGVFSLQDISMKYDNSGGN